MKKKLPIVMTIIICFQLIFNFSFQISAVRGDYRHSDYQINLGEVTLNSSEYIIENVSVPSGNRDYHLASQVTTNETIGIIFLYLDVYILKEAGYNQFITNQQTSQIDPGNIVFKGDQISGGNYFGRCDLGVSYYILIISKHSSPILVQYYFGRIVPLEVDFMMYFLIGFIGLCLALGIALIVVIKKNKKS